MRLITAVFAVVTLLSTACRRSSDLPAVGSEQYRKLCTAFYLGLAALQSGEDVNARKGLTAATQIAPAEPAGWADLGLLQFRQQDYEGAFASVQKAQALVPENSRIEALLGVIQSRRGQPTETLVHLQRAVSLDSGNLKALYSLAQETARQNTEATDAQAQKLLAKILAKQPNNIAVLVDVVRLAAKRNDTAGLKQAVGTLKASASTWPAAATEQLKTLENESVAANVKPAAIQAQFLRNVLVRVPAYRQSLDEVRTPATSAGEPFLKFLRLPSPSSEPSAPDLAMRFESKNIRTVPATTVAWLGTFVPDDKQGTQVIWADSQNLHIGGAKVPLPGDQAESHQRLTRHAILPADLNYDFKTDLVIATERGIGFYQQKDLQHFTDVTADTKLPSAILHDAYRGAWAFDVDLDGDLDVVLGSVSGQPLVLRNNGDGTFAAMHPFKGVDGLIAFASADIDGDGDPDVALLDKNGGLKVFANERLGDYHLRDMPAAMKTPSVDVSAADVDGDGLPDFVILQKDGRVMRLSDRASGKDWNVGELAAAQPIGEEQTIDLADLDNNGALDLIANGQAFLSDGHRFTRVSASLPFVTGGFLPSNSAGRLEIVGLTPDGKPVESKSSGTKRYRFQEVRPRAATTNGDQRINSFGIGGEIQLRSELLTQMQIITSPILHFGLGDHSSAEFARIVWPNGLIQTEFALKANQTLLAEQRLKGSCPLLFAWNGYKMQYVKDVAPMSGALGAHDASGKTAPIEQTEEWFKIDSGQLKPKNGSLDVSVTDEYWETYYIDRYSLRAIDHPKGTQVFVDERVAVPVAPLGVYVTGALHSFAAAQDEQGRDVSRVVQNLDHRYLDSFPLGKYQGIARDHWVELTLPLDAPRKGSLYLIGDGWLHPWDDGLLVAVNQGRQAKPTDLSLEVLNRDGHWITAKRDLGVPAGREKTVVLDLTNVFQPGAPRRLRLRTNLEIYWDRLSWATGISAENMHGQELTLTNAALSHRGYSRIEQGGSYSPEVPVYQELAASDKKWQPIAGYYTRYGDVTPLLQRCDDRYVIAGSGDELHLRFDPGPAVPAGFVRDYVFEGDGWMKEGDYSFKYSRTVLPLPDHSMHAYQKPLTELEDDNVYQHHKSDWQLYHTRYVPAENLASGLWK
ncbi:MAG TPA: FG-GAP-like repeat-containing protein [Bryobacteraceae bacterium]|nr:FG-GAP-like repeat-containing protein [Bryobacteraceae bacterium]